MTHVLLIASVSIVVLFLVLTALAGMVNLLTKLISQRDAPLKSDIIESRPLPEISDGEALDKIAAVVGVALARARARGAPSRQRRETPRIGFIPWRDVPRNISIGHFDRGWRPR